MYKEDITQSIAKAAQEVLEGYGKKKMKKEEMDPTDHVKEKDGKFCVYNKDGDVVKEFDKEDDANKYAIANHDKLMAEVAEPVSKTGKKIKADHKVKVSGDEEDADNVKEAKHDDEDEEDLDEAESNKQKKYKAFFDKALKKFGVDSPAELKGDKKKEFFDYVDANYEADNESD
jgi:hypothetical protein